MSTENTVQTKRVFSDENINVHAFFPPPGQKKKYDGQQYYNDIFIFKQTKTLTGLHCRSLQTLSYAALMQNQWFWIKIFDNNISFSLHQAESNIWCISVLQQQIISEGKKNENKNRHCKSLPESV